MSDHYFPEWGYYSTVSQHALLSALPVGFHIASKADRPLSQLVLNMLRLRRLQPTKQMLPLAASKIVVDKKKDCLEHHEVIDGPLSKNGLHPKQLDRENFPFLIFALPSIFI